MLPAYRAIRRRVLCEYDREMHATLLPLSLALALTPACRTQEKPIGTDDTAPACTPSLWYADADGDGYGSAVSQSACDAPAGYVAVTGDCNDADSTVFPGAPVACTAADGNCDGSPDNVDADGDHYLGCEDCDDANAAVNPDAGEICNGIDDNCDGQVDVNAVDAPTWYDDVDGDGFGAGTGTAACEAPASTVNNADDCDDANAAVNPDAVEVCNGTDDNCDGQVDENGTDATTWYIDYDGDGFGSAAYTRVACDAASGWVADDTDCDDTDAAVSPAGTEVCNGVDDNCDGAIDENTAVDAPTWYLDADGDGHGSTTSALACDAPASYVATSDDCDDGDSAIYPGAVERCDGLDQNCDGIADDGALGADVTCAAPSCQAILADGSSTGDGLYWLAPDGDTASAWQAYCDMTTDGGGWTRLYGSLWPTFWDASDWETVGAATDDVYSHLDQRTDFVDASGGWTFRLEVGDSGTWNTSARSHYTVWSQSHDPFTDATDGSDYTYISGAESTTCSGFNGLHDTLYADYHYYALASDVDSTDYYGCWWMQIVPLDQYVDPVSYPGYLEGYDGPNTHVWQVLWMR